MGRLSDFIDRQTEKRNQRENEMIQPFMQQMDTLIKVKEQKEVQDQTQQYYTSEAGKYGGDIDFNAPSETYPQQLKSIQETGEDINYALEKGYVKESDLKGKTREEQHAFIKANQPTKAPQQKVFESGGYKVTEEWDGFKWIEKGRAKITSETEKAKLKKPSTADQKIIAEAEKVGIPTEGVTNLGELSVRTKTIIAKQKEIEKVTYDDVGKYAEEISKSDVEKLGKSWLGVETEKAKERTRILESGEPLEVGDSVYVKIGDKIYKFKDNVDSKGKVILTALQRANNFSKKYPEKIKKLEAEIEELRGTVDVVEETIETTGGYKKDEVVNGYKYLGGDYSDKNNWEKVQ